MEVTDPVSNIDIERGYVCLRWATADEEDRTLNIQQSLNDNHVLEGEYYRLVPFSSIQSTVTVVRSNIAIDPFTDQLPWPFHRFHLNRFISAKAGTMGLDTELSQSPVCPCNVGK